MKEETPQIAQLPLKLLNDVLGYLGTKPYGEVFGYIQAIQQNTIVLPAVIPAKPPIGDGPEQGPEQANTTDQSSEA